MPKFTRTDECLLKQLLGVLFEDAGVQDVMEQLLKVRDEAIVLQNKRRITSSFLKSNGFNFDFDSESTYWKRTGRENDETLYVSVDSQRVLLRDRMGGTIRYGGCDVGRLKAVWKTITETELV